LNPDLIRIRRKMPREAANHLPNGAGVERRWIRMPGPSWYTKREQFGDEQWVIPKTGALEHQQRNPSRKPM